ncbi:MAG: FxSxx-COOH cyclophane-containing RiPP peptide [Actinoplanes sp.]
MDRTTEDGAPEWRSPMVDVSGMSLDDLARHADNSAVLRSLRRVADDLAEPGEPIAGFNSAL